MEKILRIVALKFSFFVVEKIMEYSSFIKTVETWVLLCGIV